MPTAIPKHHLKRDFSITIIWFFVIISLLFMSHPQAQTPSDTTTPRTITADLSTPSTPRSRVYRACVGAGRIGEGLRADWQQQLKVCRDEIGFEQIRFHGLLHDEMGVYTEDKSGKPHYNWQYIDMVYDYLLSIGVRPFVEISFMPEALASGTKTVFWWKANVTPPKDYAKWDELVRKLVQHWTDRYGVDEVKRWNFEIWNEPNHHAFFAPKDESTRMNDYFELYAHTAKAVTSVNPDYKVGGPASAAPVWVPEMIDFCAKQNVPLSFISFHMYNLAGGPGGFDEFGNMNLYFDPDLRAVARVANSEFPSIEKSAKPHLPVEITEWSTSFSSRDPIHESYFSAPFILEQLRHTEKLSSMSYWTFTDIFEESGVGYKPFHGGFGLINLQGIKKPSFFAFKFLNMLGGQEVKSNDPRTYIATDDKGGIQVLFWDLTMIRPLDTSDQVFFGKLHPTEPAPDVTVALAHCPSGAYQMSVYRVGYEKNDAYSRYLEMGAPDDLSPKQTAELKDLASGKPESQSEIKIGADGKFTQTFPMRKNDVYLITLTKK